MNGTKRLTVSDLNDTAFRNKRIMAESPFDVHRGETSAVASIATPPLPLNTQRAESSRQHVRALNRQFASWVQMQLTNHPDELWEDGVRDYLNHASSILEKFSDVVNWLKANAGKEESVPAIASYTTENKILPEANNNENKFKLMPESNNSENKFKLLPETNNSENKLFPKWNNNENKLFQEKTGIAPINTTTSFQTSWNPGILSGSQTHALFGNQNLVPSNNEASHDADDEDDVEQPSSPSVKKTEEKGIIVVHEVKCKLYVKSSDPVDKDAWKDKGMGQLTIRCKEGIGKGTKESKPTIVVRNEVGKILLNALLYPGIKTNSQKNSLVAIFHTSGDVDGNSEEKGGVVARTFLIRLKTGEDRNKLATVIQEYAPASL